MRLCVRVKICSIGDIFFLFSQTFFSVLHGGGSETLGVFLNCLLLYFLERGSANVLEIWWQQAHIWPPQRWDYRQEQPRLAFIWIPRIWTHVFMLTQQVPLFHKFYLTYLFAFFPFLKKKDFIYYVYSVLPTCMLAYLKRAPGLLIDDCEPPCS